jgi:hypothetical protein
LGYTEPMPLFTFVPAAGKSVSKPTLAIHDKNVQPQQIHQRNTGINNANTG